MDRLGVNIIVMNDAMRYIEFVVVGVVCCCGKVCFDDHNSEKCKSHEY